jgi:hypothetical protein
MAPAQYPVRPHQICAVLAGRPTERTDSDPAQRIVNPAVAECAVEPLVPVIVNVKVPRGLDFATATVIVEDPEEATEAGLKDAVVPSGSPLAVSETTPPNPLCEVIETVYVVAVPRRTVREDGLTLIPKSGGGVTTREAAAERTSPPLVPVTVSG